MESEISKIPPIDKVHETENTHQNPETKNNREQLRQELLKELADIVEDLIDKPKQVGSALILALLLTGKGTLPRDHESTQQQRPDDPNIEKGPGPGDSPTKTPEEVFIKWQKYLNDLANEESQTKLNT